VRLARPLFVCLNFALGARETRPFLEELARIADTRVGCYPNAGLPNAFGQYEEPPEETAALPGAVPREGPVSLVGACCGTTPDPAPRLSWTRRDAVLSPGTRLDSSLLTRRRAMAAQGRWTISQARQDAINAWIVR
jgi:hypothetical protein